jgi:hypothetical protein
MNIEYPFMQNDWIPPPYPEERVLFITTNPRGDRWLLENMICGQPLRYLIFDHFRIHLNKSLFRIIGADHDQLIRLTEAK